jgi:hypothetical protein
VFKAVLSLVAIAAVATTIVLAPAPRPAAAGREGGAGLARVLPDADGSIARAAASAVEGLQWMALDGHLHTDHSHDAGLPHQQEGTPASHDTFLDEQRDQAIRMGMDAVAFTDHRTFGQHFDPAYSTNDAVLITGEEWGGSRHATAFGTSEVLENGPDTRVGCGVAEMTLEAAAQDALLGVAHPGDGKVNCIDPKTFVAFPMSHLETLRGGNNLAQERQLLPTNGVDLDFYVKLLQAGGRIAAFNGSDNHFKQVWPGPSGPGGSVTYALVREMSDPAFRDAVRAGRTMAGLGAGNPKVTTLLDANRDGTFDAVTGGWAAPASGTVTVAVRVEGGSGQTVQLFDDANRIVAEEAVALPDQTLAFDVPASSAYYRAQMMREPVTRVGLPDPLYYVDVMTAVSTPVWTSAPPVRGDPPALSTGSATALSDADWSGFARVARVGDTVHTVWQERRSGRYSVAYARSADAGASWSAPQILSTGTDARTPALTAAGDHVLVAWENHNPGRFGGDLVTATSDDAGATFTAPAVTVPGNTARPAVATADGVDHLAWMEPAADGTWGIRYARRTDATGFAPMPVSTAKARVCCETQYALPPRTVMHIPAAASPALAVSGSTVALAWEDNRQDPTPLRNGTPDDWGIFSAVSHDGGRTFSAEQRVSPRHLRRDNAEPEGVEGNPARQADVAILPDGGIVVAYSDPFGSGAANVWTQRSGDGGATWADPVALAPPSDQWAYRPRLVVEGAQLRAVWQESSDPTWGLRTASSSDGGRSFGPPSNLSTAGRFSGYPSVAPGVVVFTAETPSGFAVHAGALPE